MEDNKVRQVINTSKYISHTVLDQCFENGTLLHVDKVLCGNGFSTAFLTQKPPTGKFNILLAPNKAVVIGKEQTLSSPLKINYIYEESANKNIDGYDVVMFVSDSFVYMLKEVLKRKHLIHRILLDEYHSIEIQSSFRYSLVRFLDKVTPFLQHSAVTTVTATPNLAAPIDIKIQNLYTKPLTINYTNDRVASIKRARKLIRKGLPVFICTNDVNTLHKFKNKDKVIKARFVIGDAFARSVSKRLIAFDDQESVFVMSTSRGFEGFDLYEKDYNVFFFENRGSKYETFYLSNLYQAINRARNGVAYVEWSRIELSSKRRSPSVDQIKNFFTNPKLSPEQKAGSQYKQYHPYLVFDNTASDGSVVLYENTAAIRLHHETLLYDHSLSMFREFLADREITILNLDEQQNKLPLMRTQRQQMIDMLKTNEKFIEEHGLFGSDYTFKPEPLKSFSKYAEAIDVWQIEKNYNQRRGVLAHEEVVVSALNDRRIVDFIIDTHLKEKKKELKPLEYEDYAKTWIKTAETNIGELIASMINRPIVFRKNWVIHRNYNVLTTMSKEDISTICESVGVTVTEIDIKAAFPRICYALCGKELPNDFYGDSDNIKARTNQKIKVNAALNNAWYDSKLPTPRATQLANARRRLTGAGMDTDVTEYILSNFFDSEFKGDFFNKMAFYEKELISQIKSDLIRIGGNDGVERRHDSVLIFNNKASLDWVYSYEYLTVGGWFGSN